MNRSLGGRYAYVMYTLCPKSILDDFDLFSQVLKTGSAIKDLMIFYNFEPNKAQLIFDSLLKIVSKEFVAFLKVLLKNHRIHLFFEIYKNLVRLFDKKDGVIRRRVEFAYPLDPRQKSTLEKHFLCAYKHNPNLLGGITIVGEESLVDLSIRGWLDQATLHIEKISIH